MNNSLAPKISSFNLESFVAETDRVGKIVLWGITQTGDDFKIKDLLEVTGLAYSPTRARLQQFELRDLITRTELLSNKTGVRPTYVYHLAYNITVEAIQDALRYIFFSYNRPEVSSSSQAEAKRDDSQATHRRVMTMEQPLSTIFAQLRNASTYISLVNAVADQGSVTINDLTKMVKTGRKGTVHSQLEKLRELGVLEREKRYGENQQVYFYFLAPGITKEQVKELKEMFNTHSDLTVTPTNSAKSSEVEKPREQTNEERRSIQYTSFDLDTQKAEIDALLAQLPLFDPSWSKEVQSRWYSLLRIALDYFQKSVAFNQSNQ